MRRTRREIDNWNEFTHAGRAFVRAIIPRGLNEDQEYVAARRIAERYEIKRFFASGGFGLVLACPCRSRTGPGLPPDQATSLWVCPFGRPAPRRVGTTGNSRDQRPSLGAHRNPLA